VTSDEWFSSESVLRLVLFNIVAGNMDSGIECILTKSADNTRLCGCSRHTGRKRCHPEGP